MELLSVSLQKVSREYRDSTEVLPQIKNNSEELIFEEIRLEVILKDRSGRVAGREISSEYIRIAPKDDAYVEVYCRDVSVFESVEIRAEAKATVSVRTESSASGY